MAQVPHTRTLLKGNIELRSVSGGMFMADTATIAANWTILPILGAAQKLEIEQTRSTNNFRREFNPALQGQPAETYPGLPEYRITLERVNLYDMNFLEAFGFVGVNIVEQYIPIVVAATQVVPVDAAGSPLEIKGTGSTMKARTYIIPGCWFDELPMDFDITADDQKMIQTVRMICQTIHPVA